MAVVTSCENRELIFLPDHQTFLGFAWKFSGDTEFRYFVFTVLPFGLASAPFIFTTCL